MYSAILLVAGESTRMGTLKALLPWGKVTLLEAQIEQAACSQLEELVIVLGYKYEQFQPLILEMKERLLPKIHISIAVNHLYKSGKTSSIRLGVKALSLRSKGLAILGVDQPVLANTMDQLLLGLRDDEIRVPTFQKKKGHPPIFSSDYYSELICLTEEEEGLRQMMRINQEKILFLEVNEPLVLLNLNCEQDYRKARESGLDNYMD